MSKYEKFERSVRFRADDSIVKFLEQLAAEAERTPSEFIRDLIWYMRMSMAGPVICKHLIQEGIHYRPRRRLDEPTVPPMEKVVFPWDHLPKKEG